MTLPEEHPLTDSYQPIGQHCTVDWSHYVLARGMSWGSVMSQLGPNPQKVTLYFANITWQTKVSLKLARWKYKWQTASKSTLNILRGVVTERLHLYVSWLTYYNVTEKPTDLLEQGRRWMLKHKNLKCCISDIPTTHMRVKSIRIQLQIIIRRLSPVSIHQWSFLSSTIFVKYASCTFTAHKLETIYPFR